MPLLTWPQKQEIPSTAWFKSKTKPTLRSSSLETCGVQFFVYFWTRYEGSRRPSIPYFSSTISGSATNTCLSTLNFHDGDVDTII
jgi:hypothetical protein